MENQAMTTINTLLSLEGQVAIITGAVSVERFGESGHGVLAGRRGLEAYQRTKAIQIITD